MVNAPIFQAGRNIVVGREISKCLDAAIETIQEGDSILNHYDSL
jgi:hypothetical protein